MAKSTKSATKSMTDILHIDDESKYSEEYVNSLSDRYLKVLFMIYAFIHTKQIRYMLMRVLNVSKIEMYFGDGYDVDEGDEGGIYICPQYSDMYIECDPRIHEYPYIMLIDSKYIEIDSIDVRNIIVMEINGLDIIKNGKPTKYLHNIVSVYDHYMLKPGGIDYYKLLLNSKLKGYIGAKELKVIRNCTNSSKQILVLIADNLGINKFKYSDITRAQLCTLIINKIRVLF